jgi:hypothetical protein
MFDIRVEGAGRPEPEVRTGEHRAGMVWIPRGCVRTPEAISFAWIEPSDQIAHRTSHGGRPGGGVDWREVKRA